MKTPTRVIALFCFLALAACRGAPVYSVEQAPLNAPKGATLSQISKAMKVAGAQLGWQLRDVSPGQMVGTLAVRKHVAKVDIVHDKKTYSIRYKDSINLKYDGATIHNNYNGWVQNLQKAIQAQVLAL